MSGDSSQHYKRYFWKEGLLYRSYKDTRHSPEISQLVITEVTPSVNLYMMKLAIWVIVRPWRR